MEELSQHESLKSECTDVLYSSVEYAYVWHYHDNNNVHLTAAYMKKNCHGAVGFSLFLERAQKVLCISAASVVRAISFHLFH